MSWKVADQLVATLTQAGVKHLYAVTGDSLNHVNDAVRRAGTIEWIHVRHEETGAFAAAAEAELNGLACCAGSSGPGHVHLINGLYDAHHSGTSMLAIASTCATGQFGSDYFQETDPVRLFDDCSCYNQLAATPGQFARMLPMALQHAVHRHGVAVVGLPGDVAGAPAAESPATPRVLFSRSICRPQDSELHQLTTMIHSARKITLFCGVGAREAHDEVIQLAAKLKAPVAYSFKAKMDIQYDNPFEIGMTGLLGLPSAYVAMHESDLLLLLGTDFPYSDFIPDNVHIAQIDIRPERLGRRAHVELGLHGDVKDTLQALIPLVEQREDQTFMERQCHLYGKLRDTMAHQSADPGSAGKIAPEFVTAIIDNAASDSAIFCVDTGMCCVWGARYLHASPRRRMLGSFNHGSMANALPMAIGAALARPDQQIVALCGDGGLSMLLGDLATVVQYELPIKIVVFNNHALGMVKLEMEVAGLPDWQTDLCNPDFETIARAMGMSGYTVDVPEEFEATLRKALTQPGPVLIDVHTDPNALAMPPKIEFKQMKGFATAMAKLILEGRSDEVLSTVKSNLKHLQEVL